VIDRPGLRYQCVASYALPGSVREWVGAFRSPWALVSSVLFHLLYRVTAVRDERYPCAPAGGGEETLRAMLGELPPASANDGVVPLTSQLWGEAVWVGKGDHLDVVGHFPGPGGHTDWLASGAHFSLARFETLVDRVFDGMLRGERGG
jgi:hypothetical protein